MHIAWILMSLLTDGHPQVEPVPQSKLVVEKQEANEQMIVTYSVGEARRRKRVGGPYWYLEYNLPYEVERPAIIDHFKAESERLNGTIRQDAGNRLTFSVLRDDGGDTWCRVWATDGEYTLEIVEDQPPDHTSFDEAPTPSATIVFTRGEDSFDRGARGALDAIAQWLEARPEYSAEVRGHRGPLEDPELPERRAHAVMQAILERGIAETRVSLSEDAAETGFEVTVVAVEP